MAQKTLKAAALSVLIAAAVWAQDSPLPGAPPDMTPGELQRMFDAFVLVQAQDQLQLTDTQYPQFVARLKKLQDARLRQQQERQRLLRELGALANVQAPNEAVIKERLAELRRWELQSGEDRAAAYAGIDEILDVRQQVRFRLFEERMERRRLELLMRAGARPQAIPPAQRRRQP